MSKESQTKGIENLVGNIDARSALETPIDAIGLTDVLRGLPEEQKFVVDYLYFKGYSQSELAEEFGIPLGTVKTRLRSAIQYLRTTLKVS